MSQMRRPLISLLTVFTVIALLAALLVTTSVLGGRGSTVSLTTAPETTGEPPAVARGRDLHVVKKYRKLADIICEKKRAAHDRPGRCRRVATLRTSYRYRDLNPARQRTGGNKYWCKDWSAVMRGLYYVNWKEEAKGTYCWVEGPGFPDIYRNRWRCGYSSAIGYDVHVEDCWDQRRSGDTTAGWWISVYDKFRVSAAFRGFPLHWTHQFHVNLHPTGTVALKIDD